RPRRSTRTRPARSSCLRCRLVVGHVQSKRAAISPAVISPPWKCRTSRMCRRDACASPAKTWSSSSSSRLAFRLVKNGQRLYVRELHVGSPVPLLRELVHRLPDRHHLWMLVGVTDRLFALPGEDLDEQWPAALLRPAIVLRFVVRHQIEGVQGRPMALEETAELGLPAGRNAIEADHRRGSGHAHVSFHLAHQLNERCPVRQARDPASTAGSRHFFMYGSRSVW